MPISVFLRFLLSGGAAATANIASRVLFSTVVNYSVSIVLAYIVGLFTGYILMKYFVFRTDRPASVGEYARYILVNLATLGQVWVLSIFLRDYFFPSIGYGFHLETTAHAIAVLSPVITSYFLHTKYTFGVR